MDSTKSSAPAHPSDDDDDDTVEARFSGLGHLRPCACLNGTAYIGHLVEEDGEEVEIIEPIACRCCAEEAR